MPRPLFMLMGTCVLFLGGGPTIGHNFSWAALVLIGVTALLYSFIRTNAAVFGRAPISESSRNLRAILFYMGVAWGAGAFLAVPPDLPPLQAILFAVIPAMLLAVLLNDLGGLAAFQAPAGALTVGAAFALSWPHSRSRRFVDPDAAMGSVCRYRLAPPIPSSRGSRVALNSCGRMDAAEA